MEALEFRHGLLRYLASRVTYRAWKRAWSARIAPLYHIQREPPVATEPGWLRARVRLSGICGSDLSMVTGQDSLSLEPEATYPFVPGHELVVELETLPIPGGGTALRGGLAPGRRAVVWPILGCRARNLHPCPACASGWDGLCTRRHDGWPGPGLATGFNRDTGGGWAESCLVHASQLWPLPDNVSDEDAVMLDPAATALGGLLRSAGRGETLVIGGGSIGLLCGHLDRALGLSDSCEVLVHHDAQERWAVEHGIDATVVRDEAHFQSWADDRSIGYKHVVGYGRVYEGRYARVLVTAATPTAIQWALDAVQPRGTLVLIAAPTNLRGLDPTKIWYREVSVQGIYDYAPVPWEGSWVHPYEVLIPNLATGRLRFRDFVTHQFPLSAYATAFSTAVRRARSGAIKVAFRPTHAVAGGTPQ